MVKILSRAALMAGAFLAIATLIATPIQADTTTAPSTFGWSSTSNIVERLERNGNFTILLTALDRANLKETLANGGPFTLFAPTDAAFAALLAQLQITPEQLLSKPELSSILLYHVAPGKLGAGKLLYRTTQETLSDSQPVMVALEGTKVLVNRATVTRANMLASNGYIHVIDKVLLPPSEPITINSIVDVLQLDGRFTILLAALDRTGLDAALAGPNELTLFAPTDQAFQSLLSGLNITAGQLLENPDLSSILLYHVVSGRERALPLLFARKATTLQGDSLSVSLRPGGVFINDSRVVNPNLNAPNGIIHTIDKVLLP